MLFGEILTLYFLFTVFFFFISLSFQKFISIFFSLRLIFIILHQDKISFELKMDFISLFLVKKMIKGSDSFIWFLNFSLSFCSLLLGFCLNFDQIFQIYFPFSMIMKYIFGYLHLLYLFFLFMFKSFNREFLWLIVFLEMLFFL